MAADSNKQVAKDGYAAFIALDAEGAMKDMSDAIEWVVSGDSAISGTYRGKEEVGGFWMKIVEKGFQTSPKEFLADGDKVVVLTETTIDGEKVDTVDVLDFDGDGRLARFQAYGGEALLNRAFPR
ncbi:nuclear transport factor 2 family protein [Marmoricola sp. RAF53]|uniref:nuclear transport factor 2 family protein n=1 Tax=Marmoricola sp. RAF53 TaxID=3233059 RepID=UPI003F99949D